MLFLPVESLYAEVARIDGLLEALQAAYRVLVAGPSTFAALLTSLQMGFRTVALQKRSGEVLALLVSVKAEFQKYGEAVQSAHAAGTGLGRPRLYRHPRPRAQPQTARCGR